MVKDDLAALARLSERIGGDIALVQGAGGNTSIKLGSVLWVKASGRRLADALRTDIFVAVSLDEARAAIETGAERIPPLKSAAADATLRPSIETSLHALMPQPVVLHVHSVNAIAWGVQPDAAVRLSERMRGLNWTALPYLRPGIPLARALAATIATRPPEVILLGNHGLVVAAADCEAAAALLQEVERRLAVPARRVGPPDTRRLAELAAGTRYETAAFRECHEAALARLHLRVAAGGSLYPDHVVFLGAGARVLSPEDSITEVSARQPMPAFLLVPEAGMLVRRGLGDDAMALLRCLGLVLARLPDEAHVSYLAPEEERMLLDWDAEKYRASLSRAAGSAATPAPDP
jgi:rhamnose utilization protein RhaD (predicted bifunctional aldolase and dehydrogenase)